MADVFISYKTEDRPHALQLVVGLRSEGLSVWWDQDIAPDAPWEATIEHELRTAHVTVVVWSPAAVASENVRSEARWARSHGKLIQVFAVPCEPPLFFGERQGVNLQGWRGNGDDHRFQTVLQGARAIIAGEAPPRGVGYAPVKRRPRTVLITTCAGLLVVAGLGAAYALHKPVEGAPKKTSEDASASAARMRANLLQSLSGVWDRQGGACAAPLKITVDTSNPSSSTITVLGSKGFKSVGQVIAVEGDEIMARDIEASGAAGQTSEYRSSGSLMTIVDGRGVTTSLVRCRST